MNRQVDRQFKINIPPRWGLAGLGDGPKPRPTLRGVAAGLTSVAPFGARTECRVRMNGVTAGLLTVAGTLLRIESNSSERFAMLSDMLADSETANRPLTETELHLARWMLEHGTPEAKEFLPQLELAEVTPWRCASGCASIDFQIKGRPPAPPGVHILADFVFGNDDNLAGIFVFEKEGILKGLEVYGLAGDALNRCPLRIHCTAQHCN